MSFDESFDFSDDLPVTRPSRHLPDDDVIEISDDESNGRSPARPNTPPVPTVRGVFVNSVRTDRARLLERLRETIRKIRTVRSDPYYYGRLAIQEADRKYRNAFEAYHGRPPAPDEEPSEHSLSLADQPTRGKTLPDRLLAKADVPQPTPPLNLAQSGLRRLPRGRLERQDATVEPERDVSPVRNPHGQAPSKPTSMAKDWCYTFNNPALEDVERLRNCHTSNTPKVLYHVFQLERGASGNLHIQGFICLANKARMSTVKTFLGKAVHLEIRRGTPKQAADYCRDPSKRDPDYAGFLHEFGELPDAPPGQGARSDLAAVQALLDDHVPMATVAREHFSTWVKAYKAFDKYVTEFVSEPRKEKSIFFCFTGESGTGKSQAAYAFRNAFTVPPGSSGVAWFDGYDATRHQTVLFDEFYGSRCSWNELLRLTDKYPHTVNTKGSQVQFNPKAIVFTSNFAPQDWYPNIQEKTPLMRRIDSHWEYFRRNTNLVAPNVLQAVEGLELANKCKYHAIVQCVKGDPTYHPLVNTYVPLMLDHEGKSWFVIPVAEDKAAAPVQGLW